MRPSYSRFLTTGKTFSDDLQLEFGRDKCTTVVFKHVKLAQSQNVSLNNQKVIRNMELDETYTYLDVKELDGIDNCQMKTIEETLLVLPADSQDKVKLEA
jgi:hypothetical protein